MKKLSIIIPHYNSVKTLNKLLLSIPNLSEIEILVIDDKSNHNLDELNNLIKNNTNNNIIFIENKTDKKGAGVCRNLGLKRATGEYILFADSDDFFIDEFYDIVSKYFELKKDVVFFVPTSIEMNSGNISDRHERFKKIILDYEKNQDRNSELFLRYKFEVPWSKLIKADFLRKHEIYFDEVIASNDVMFSIKVGHHMKDFDVSKEIIYCATRHKGSLTTNTSEYIFDTRLSVYIDYCNYLDPKLNKREKRLIRLRGTGYVVGAIKYGYGPQKIFSVISILKKNNIKIFDCDFLNPKYVLKKIMENLSSYKKNKKYYVKDN